MALFEYRVYEATPGKLPALHSRFQNTTFNYFRKHVIGIVGFWDVVVGTSNELHYMLRFDDMAHRDRAWGAFQADPGWIQDRAATEVDGPLVQRVHNVFLRETPYSPLS